ncbi:hypothetical protein BHM03_00053343 [Ensete ventricosum]|nr:hypothetical protein BHM03_00053343 [Ensete ventricosum]
MYCPVPVPIICRYTGMDRLAQPLAKMLEPGVTSSTLINPSKAFLCSHFSNVGLRGVTTPPYHVSIYTIPIVGRYIGMN